MNLTKKQRREVREKSNGICWYCGTHLPEKGWHIDHLVPIIRYSDGIKRTVSCERPELDVMDNIVPSCRNCNLFKGVFSVEEFRHEISKQIERARAYSVNFRTAERFGLIEIINKPIMFWFESNYTN